jgi:uncharacterized protein YjiS (DUF1127 family)
MRKTVYASWLPEPVELRSGRRHAAGASLPRPSYAFYRAARARRSAVLAVTCVRAWRSARALLARALRAWVRHREARGTAIELHALDDRTLRDLGFSRAEIGSVAAELSGSAERTRLLADRRQT